MNKNKLEIVRKKIDRIDKKLLNIIFKRTNLVKKVILIKSQKKQIVDKKRINKVLKNIRKQSIKKKIDPEITKKIWIAMIRSYIEYERKKFKKK